MRYLLRPVGRLGTLHTVVRTYANDRNAIRYLTLLLRHDNFPPGQYEVSTFPHIFDSRPVGTLYKTV